MNNSYAYCLTCIINYLSLIPLFSLCWDIANDTELASHCLRHSTPPWLIVLVLGSVPLSNFSRSNETIIWEHDYRPCRQSSHTTKRYFPTSSILLGLLSESIMPAEPLDDFILKCKWTTQSPWTVAWAQKSIVSSTLSRSPKCTMNNLHVDITTHNWRYAHSITDIEQNTIFSNDPIRTHNQALQKRKTKEE